MTLKIEERERERVREKKDGISSHFIVSHNDS